MEGVSLPFNGGCPKSEDIEQVFTEAKPLAWIPPAAHGQLQDPQFVSSYVDGNFFDLPEGWIVERRPRTSLKYFGKVEKFYYEPGTKKQFRSLKAAQEHLTELKAKQNNQQPPWPQPENDYNKASDELKPVSQSRKRKQALCIESDSSNPPKKVTCILSDAKNDHEQVLGKEHDQISLLTLGEQQTEETHDGSGGNSSGGLRKPTKESNMAQTSAENDQWNTIVDQKLVPEAGKDSGDKTFNDTLDSLKNKAPEL